VIFTQQLSIKNDIIILNKNGKYLILTKPKIFHFNYTVKIRASRTPGKSGSLCQFTQLKAAKDGSVYEYPTIEGERDPENIDHWYWHFTYKERNKQGKFVTRTKTVPRRQVLTVRDRITQDTPVARILEYLESAV
jgi:hypothetical protein